MVDSESGALLTPSQREWFVDGEVPEYERQTRSAVYARLREAIRTDAEAVTTALEDGTLNRKPVVQELSFDELIDGISGLVAALYLLGEAKSGLDVESVILEGVRRGKEGEISVIEEKIEREGIASLSINEMLELREAKPDEYRDRINRALDLALSDSDVGFVDPDELDEIFGLDDEQ